MKKHFASLAIQNAQSEDSDQTAHAQSDLNLHFVHIFKGMLSAVAAYLIFSICKDP